MDKCYPSCCNGYDAKVTRAFNQVVVFANCDLMVSVHGSHNANIMFMRCALSVVMPLRCSAHYHNVACMCAIKQDFMS